MTKKKIIYSALGVLLLLIIAAGIYAYSIYSKMNSPAFESLKAPLVVYIDESKDFTKLTNQLSEAKINDIDFFIKLSDWMDYDESMKTGRFEFSEDISYLSLIRTLRSSRQPMKFTFNNIRLKEDFAKKMGETFMFSGDTLLNRLNNANYTKGLGFDTLTILSMFIPNTYEMYWDISADQFIEKMKSEYDRFWNEERLKKAKDINLTPIEASILASIVEEETAQPNEYPIVAGLYLNRLNKGMLLQADPTVKYAVGDVTLKRILNKHLTIDSPYNTYKYSGLPPGLIRQPSIQSIDAVLNPTQHNYIYMCAKEDFSGTHNFAVTLTEHSRNARKYQDALNRIGIR